MATKGTHVMRAKVQINLMEHYSGSAQKMVANPVTGAPFDKDGISEDNTYSRYSPSGEFSLSITNPALVGKLKPGQKFYVDFILAEDDEETSQA